MTFGQLFMTMHPDVMAIENGSCVWLFMDEVNHYTIANEWWNQEVTGYALELLKEQEYKTWYWENGHCTCCGEDIASKLDTWTNVQTFSFCPKCGAKMKVKLDE